MYKEYKMTLTVNIHLATFAANATPEQDAWDAMGLSRPDSMKTYGMPGWKQAKWEVEDEDEASDVLEVLRERQVTWARC